MKTTKLKFLTGGLTSALAITLLAGGGQMFAAEQAAAENLGNGAIAK
jgi:hypothetical protein